MFLLSTANFECKIGENSSRLFHNMVAAYSYQYNMATGEKQEHLNIIIAEMLPWWFCYLKKTKRKYQVSLAFWNHRPVVHISLTDTSKPFLWIIYERHIIGFPWGNCTDSPTFSSETVSTSLCESLPHPLTLLSEVCGIFCRKVLIWTSKTGPS